MYYYKTIYYYWHNSLKATNVSLLVKMIGFVHPGLQRKMTKICLHKMTDELTSRLSVILVASSK